VFAVFGPAIVRFLYAARYAEAGIILQILALGVMVDMLNGSFTGVLWAMGRTGLSTVLLIALVTLQIFGMLIGNLVYGKGGVIIGFAAAGWVLYPLHAAAYGRLGLWHPSIDLPVIAASIVVAIGVGFTADWHILATWG